ncbi:hypothetical protein [Mycobacterium sp.]|uniref:hypothetical protein n=1 Tax=Mycobacterium sp. TaxID=1785 RepID=UPI003BAB9EB1
MEFVPPGRRDRAEVGGSTGAVSVPTPIALPDTLPHNSFQLIGPLVMVAAMAGVSVVLYSAGLARYIFFPLIMLVTYGVMFFRRDGSSQKQLWAKGEAALREWSNKADAARAELAKAAERQFQRSWWSHPRPQDLVGWVGSPRMWERTRPRVGSASARQANDGSQDFAQIRLGVGTVRQATRVECGPLPDDVTWIEPASGHGLRKLLQEQSYVRGMPRVVSLAAMKAMSLVGDLSGIRGLAYALICQLCLWHSPDDVKVIVVTRSPELWDWVKWLPHAQAAAARDGCGERRLVFGSAAEFEAFYSDEWLARGKWVPEVAATGSLQHPLLIVIDDACGPASEWAVVAPPAGVAGVCFVRLAEEPGYVHVFDEAASRRSAPGLGFTDEVMYRVGDGVVWRADVTCSGVGSER